MRKLFLALILGIMFMTGITLFQSGTIFKNVAHAATTPSTIIWPMDVAGHDWTILQGYNNSASGGDHGGVPPNGNPSQLYGFDLQLRGDNTGTAGQAVRSPVGGTINWIGDAPHTNSGKCLTISFIDTSGNALEASLCHVSLTAGITVGSTPKQGDSLGKINQDLTGGNHLHFNIRKPNATPIDFTGSDQILACGKSDFPWDGHTVNQYAGLSVSCFGYWMGPTPTDSSQIHLYGNPASRTIQLGYNSNNSNGKTVDHVDFWDYQGGKWNWIGSQNPNTNQQEFTNFTLNGPGYLGVDVLTNDGLWHEAQDGVRTLCVITPSGQTQCPTPVAYHDGSTQPVGVGGGGGVSGDPGSPPPTPTPSPSDGIKICSGVNYSGTCSVFTYTGNNSSVQSLGSLAHNQDSAQFIGSYANAYDLVLCLQASCPSSDRELQHDDPNFANSITQNQYVAVRIVKNAPQIPNSDVTVYSETNYGGNHETYTYNGDNNHCINLDQMAGHNKSVKDTGFSAVMYHDTNCGTYLARYDNDASDIGWGLYDQFSSMRLEKHTAPNAPTSLTPADGTTYPSGTTSIGLSWNASDASVVHIWNDSGWNYLTDWVVGSGIGFGNVPEGTYHWEVKTRNSVGESPWSSVWNFSIGTPATPLPQGSVKLGGMPHLDVYCTSMNESGASVVNNLWYCGNGTVVMNMTNACVWSYNNSDAFGYQDTPGNPYSWNCYTPPVAPQGAWNSPSDNFIVAKNGLLHFSVNVKGSAVSTVVIRGIWGSTPWRTLCSFVVSADSLYECDWDPTTTQTPDTSSIHVGYDAFDANGTKILSSPDGDRVGTFAPVQQVPAGSVKLGGMNLDAYCQSQKTPVSGVVNNIWYCGNGTVILNLTNACQWQYTTPIAFANQEILGDPYTWTCYKPSIPKVTTGSYVVTEGKVQSNTVTTTYAGTKKLKLTTNNLPSFATFVDKGDGTGVVTFKPIGGNAATYSFTVTVTDGVTSSSTVMSLKVLPITSACAPSSSQIALFTDKNYGGRCIIKNVGMYADSTALNIANDSVSSVKIGSLVKVTLYTNSGYGGTAVTLQSNTPDLGTKKIDNATSSAKVMKR